MKICIYGAGAIGCYLAGRLGAAGKQVSVVARGSALAAIRADGVTVIEGPERLNARLPVEEDPARLGPQDLVIVCTKTPALPALARAIGPLLGRDTAVAFAVNGVFWFYGHGFTPPSGPLDLSRLDPDGALAERIGADRSLGMVIHSPNTLVEPGVVENGRPGGNRFYLGEPKPSGGRAARLAAGLDGAGCKVIATDEIRREMWGKLARNAASSPLCSLTGQVLNVTYAEPGAARLARALMREAIAVAAAHGFPDLGIEVEAECTSVGKLAHMPSMAQDLAAGRPAEIDSQLAVVVDFARQAGVDTPVLRSLLPLIMVKARAVGSY